MTKLEIVELSKEIIQLLHTRLAADGRHLCDTGLNRDQVRQILHGSVLSELQLMAEYWNIPHTADSLPESADCIPENQRDLFDA